MSVEQITDSDLGLTVHHIWECDNNSSEEVKNTRGLIKCGDKVVCKSFPFTVEVLHTDTEGIDKWIKPFTDSNTPAFKSFEGTILRVWNFEGVWRMSTHRRIDAKRSKWGSKQSYGEVFESTLKRIVSSLSDSQQPFDDYCKGLNPNYIYVFLMRNGKSNRIVCNSFDEPTLFIVGAFDRDQDFKYVPGRMLSETGVTSSEKVEYDSLDALVSKVAECPTREYQGVILISDEGKSVKLVNASYDRMCRLRDNCPNILTRYAQLLALAPTDEQAASDLELFREVYSESAEEFQNFEKTIADIIQNIHRKYVNRHIMNRVAVLPSDQHNIMKELHTLHTKNRSFKVTPEEVRNYVWGLKASHLVYLYTNYQTRKAELGNGNFVPEEIRKRIYNQLHEW